MTAVLRLESVVKRYGRRRALDGLAFQVPGGSITGLVGSNGAGKTTTMAVVAGFVRPDAGIVDVLGSGAFSAAKHAGRITVLPQDADLPRDARPLDLLEFYGALQGLSSSAARTQATEMLERVHLLDRSRSPVRTLSHGMRKRIAVAQCFLGEPELVLLDEPMSGLDPREGAALRDFILSRRGRQTMIISSHNLHEIEQLCDRVIFMERGRTVREDTLEALTGRTARARYVLDTETVPLEKLRSALPNLDMEFESDPRELICRFDAATRSPAQVHRAVLEALFAADIGVMEVHLGDRLEREYLRHTGRFPPPRIAPGADRPMS